MRQRKMRTGAPIPKALACGMLEDEGRVLFLVRKDQHGTERLEMPSTVVPSGRSPFAEIKEKFRLQTGIEGEIHEIVMESRFNAGTRRRRNWIPCLVFKVTARERRARPPPEYCGFRWLSLEDAKKQRLGRNVEWLKKASAEKPAQMKI